jgi:hypothetical protein
MPKRINIQTVDVAYDESDPEGFRSGGARLGPLLGAAMTGASVYPDSGKIGIWTGNSDDDVMVEKSSGVGYWHGEVPEA